MPNFWTVTTQKIAEAFSGPRTKDTEFDQKVEEMKVVEKSIIALKNTFQNFSNYTSGTKSFCRDFYNNNEKIYDKSTSFGALGNDITECHSQIERSYDELNTSMNDIKIATNQWTSLFIQAKNAIQKREESRKVYDHYDEKMEKLFRSRQEKIKRNVSENPKDYELFLRNEQKYKKSTEEFVNLSITAFEFMNDALNSRYESINPVISKFIELENRFYQTIFNSFRTVENIDYKFKLAAKKYINAENTYDPTKYIRGGELIKNDKFAEQSKQDVKPRSRSSIIQDRSPQIYPAKTKEITEFDQIENKFCNLDRKPSIQSKQVSNRQVIEEPEITENIENPYSQINLNNNISFAKNKYQQQQSPNKRCTSSNQYLQNNNNQNESDFNRSNNQFSNQNSNTTGINYGNTQRNLPPFNPNQNINNSNNLNQGLNFNYNNKTNNNNNRNNFDFGLMDITNTNNLQQNYNNMNNAANFYQNNQSTINSMGQNALDMNNNLNNFGISTGVPTTNYKLPTTNTQNKTSQKNDDIFKDFFK